MCQNTKVEENKEEQNWSFSWTLLYTRERFFVSICARFQLPEHFHCNVLLQILFHTYNTLFHRHGRSIINHKSHDSLQRPCCHVRYIQKILSSSIASWFPLKSKSHNKVEFPSEVIELKYSIQSTKLKAENKKGQKWDYAEVWSSFYNTLHPKLYKVMMWWILGFRCWGGERWRGAEGRGTGGWPGCLNRQEQSQRKSPLTGKHWLCNWLCEQGLWLQQQRAFWEDRPIPLHLSFSKVQLMAISLQSSRILLETFELDWVRN